AFQEHTVEKNIAEYIKKEFDAKYGHSWHCIVGRNFGTRIDLVFPSSTFCHTYFMFCFMGFFTISELPCVTYVSFYKCNPLENGSWTMPFQVVWFFKCTFGCAGSYVTHEAKHFIYFYMDSKAVLLFKSG
ncbi:unnamed protein product, partial [Musa textilis]